MNNPGWEPFEKTDVIRFRLDGIKPRGRNPEAIERMHQKYSRRDPDRMK
jgi:hypothetical protein